MGMYSADFAGGSEHHVKGTRTVQISLQDDVKCMIS